jgi:hypothetical protein
MEYRLPYLRQAGTMPIFQINGCQDMQVKLIATFATLFLLFPSLANADSCTLRPRALSGAESFGDFPNIDSYYCTSSSGKTIRITFLRLGETMAGNLAMNEAIPELAPVYGNYTLLDNDVGKELTNIFRNYARKQVYPVDTVALSLRKLEARRPDEDSGNKWRSVLLQSLPGNAPTSALEISRTFWSFSSSFPNMSELAGGDEVHPAAAERIIEKTQNWPGGFKQYIRCSPDRIKDFTGKDTHASLIDCTTIWRYLGLSDLSSLEAETRAERRKQGLSIDSTGDWDSDAAIYPRHFELFRYLGREGWKPNLVILQTEPGECGAGFRFTYTAPRIYLDVAVIDNMSNQRAGIDSITFDQDKQASLREVLGTGGSQTSTRRDVTLGPRNSILIPLQIIVIREFSKTIKTKIYEDSDVPSEITINLERNAAAVYKKLKSINQHRLFEEEVAKLKKICKSFQAPDLPERVEYKFGPSLSLRQLIFDAKQFDLNVPSTSSILLHPQKYVFTDEGERKAATELDLIQPETGGVSCPKLFSYDETSSEWVNRGKIIDEARGADHEMTGTFALPPEVTQVRIAEEEPEVSYIRNVRLLLHLKDGREAELAPVGGVRGPLVIPAYSHEDFNFDVPEAYRRVGIETSRLSVTGYYVRYSSLRLAKDTAGTP